MARIHRFSIWVSDSIELRQLAEEDVVELTELIDRNRPYLREWLPWLEGQEVPIHDLDRRKWLDAAWTREISPCTRAALARRYGKATETRIQHAEGFQISEYGRRPPVEELEQIFPR